MSHRPKSWSSPTTIWQGEPYEHGLHHRLLDVAVPDSITATTAEADAVDVLVNNAGIGWLNALEGTPMETVRRLFETNVFGTIAMMQAVLPAKKACKWEPSTYGPMRNGPAPHSELVRDSLMSS